MGGEAGHSVRALFFNPPSSEGALIPDCFKFSSCKSLSPRLLHNGRVKRLTRSCLLALDVFLRSLEGVVPVGGAYVPWPCLQPCPQGAHLLTSGAL